MNGEERKIEWMPFVVEEQQVAIGDVTWSFSLWTLQFGQRERESSRLAQGKTVQVPG